MKIKHIYDTKYLKSNDRIGLERLISECDFLHAKDLDDVIDSYDGKYVICVYDQFGEMVGFINLAQMDRNLQIEYLYIDGSCRRKGFGKVLLDSAIKDSKKLNFASTSLTVSIDNLNAKKFYERQNFIIDKVPQNSSLISMKKYNSNRIYRVGEMIYHLEKNFGIEEVLKGRGVQEKAQEFKEVFNDIYKKSEEQEFEKFEKRLNSKLFKNTILLIQGLDLKGEGLSPEDMEKAYTCKDCYLDLKKQETEKVKFENLIKDRN